MPTLLSHPGELPGLDVPPEATDPPSPTAPEGAPKELGTTANESTAAPGTTQGPPSTLGTSAPPCPGDEEPAEACGAPTGEQQAAVAEALGTFALRFYQHMAEAAQPDANLLFSPITVAMGLSHLLLGEGLPAGTAAGTSTTVGGIAVGSAVGTAVGSASGSAVGITVDSDVRTAVSAVIGIAVGIAMGSAMGTAHHCSGHCVWPHGCPCPWQHPRCTRGPLAKLPLCPQAPAAKPVSGWVPSWHTPRGWPARTAPCGSSPAHPASSRPRRSSTTQVRRAPVGPRVPGGTGADACRAAGQSCASGPASSTSRGTSSAPARTP